MRAYERSLGTVKNTPGDFQGDCLFLLIFVLSMMPLTPILKKAESEFVFRSHPQHFRHFIDYFELYCKDEC